jgi:hypothetical protein
LRCDAPAGRVRAVGLALPAVAWACTLQASSDLQSVRGSVSVNQACQVAQVRHVAAQSTLGECTRPQPSCCGSWWLALANTAGTFRCGQHLSGSWVGLFGRASGLAGAAPSEAAAALNQIQDMFIGVPLAGGRRLTRHGRRDAAPTGLHVGTTRLPRQPAQVRRRGGAPGVRASGHFGGSHVRCTAPD